jgi:hypothetical protein
MGERKQKLIAALLSVGLLIALWPALGQLLWHARVFAGRLPFPLDLEWMEGGMLTHAQRIAAGQGIYVKPSLDFIPYLYTPLYPATLGLLSFVFPLGYVLGRVVSLLAFTSALVVLGLLVHEEARYLPRWNRWPALLVAIMGASAVVASFVFTGSFYDLVRADSMLLALQALALGLIWRGHTWKSAAWAGVVIALAFFSKQTASIVGVGLGLGLLIVNWRRGLVYGAAAAAVLAAGLVFLNTTSQGWFWTYIFKLHQSHAARWAAGYKGALPEIGKHAWPIFTVLVVATVGLALTRQLRRRDIILWMVALAGVGSAFVGFATQWAFLNAFIPGVFFPVLAASVLGGRLVLVALQTSRWLATVPACVVLWGLGWQNHHVDHPKLPTVVPQAEDHVAAARLLDHLRQVPGDLFIPFHSYYGALVGKRTFVHRMGIRDVGPALGRPDGLDEALLKQAFAAVVLDWKALPGEFPHVNVQYHLWRELGQGTDSVRMFAGAETWPTQLFVPTRAAPPLPPDARRLADFETGTWQIFAAEGTAFGPGPAPAPSGMFGRYAADSTRPGVAAQGSLRSSPFTVEKGHLRFTFSGPKDPNLRVSLLVDGMPMRDDYPVGTATTVDWDVNDLVGKSATLLIEDRSSTAGIAVDEIVAY